MKRLPRKRKKEVKKIVARKSASKMVRAALATAMACTHTAIISAIPYFNVALKTVKIDSVLIDTATTISKILSEPPNSWRDFVK